MPIAETYSWLAEAMNDLLQVASSGAAIERRVRPALDRISKMNGGQGLGDALLRPNSTPFVQLIEAAAADLGLTDDPRVRLIGRATVLGYLYVRLQDDLVDEESSVDRATVFAMEVALSRHLSLLAEANISGAVWAARSRVMSRFAAVSAQEVDERGNADGLSPERVGDKFLGMAVPLFALSSFAQREDLFGDLTSYVSHLGTALQMINDVLNAPEDYANGRTTPLLRWFGAKVPEQSNHLRVALIEDAATQRAMSLARQESQRAFEIATQHKLPNLAAVAEGVLRLVERTNERLLGLLLGVQVDS